MLKTINAILDWPPVVILFAAWTGVYLVQVIKGEESGPVDQLWWIIGAMALAIFIV